MNKNWNCPVCNNGDSYGERYQHEQKYLIICPTCGEYLIGFLDKETISKTMANIPDNNRQEIGMSLHNYFKGYRIDQKRITSQIIKIIASDLNIFI